MLWITAGRKYKDETGHLQDEEGSAG